MEHVSKLVRPSLLNLFRFIYFLTLLLCDYFIGQFLLAATETVGCKSDSDCNLNEKCQRGACIDACLLESCGYNVRFKCVIINYSYSLINYLKNIFLMLCRVFHIIQAICRAANHSKFHISVFFILLIFFIIIIYRFFSRWNLLLSCGIGR